MSHGVVSVEEERNEEISKMKEEKRWLGYYHMWKYLLNILKERILSDWFKRQEELRRERRKGLKGILNG